MPAYRSSVTIGFFVAAGSNLRRNFGTGRLGTLSARTDVLAGLELCLHGRPEANENLGALVVWWVGLSSQVTRKVFPKPILSVLGQLSFRVLGCLIHVE